MNTHTRRRSIRTALMTLAIGLPISGLIICVERGLAVMTALGG